MIPPSSPSIHRLLQVIAQLRNPQGGCPWDLKQTHSSLKRYLLEEAYETLEAIDALGEAPDPKQIDHFKEELGDVLLQVGLHSQIAQDQGWFDFQEVAGQLAEKLIRRHPHVFGDPDTRLDIESAEAVTQNWQRLKAQEKLEDRRNLSIESNPADENALNPALQVKSILYDISRAQPALSRANAVSKKAVSVGFAWPDFDSLWTCVCSELDELRAELPPEVFTQNKPVIPANQEDRLEDELGDLLLATVSLAGHLGIDPEVALTRATNKFTQRFQAMETRIETPVDDMDPATRFRHLDFEAWDILWKQAKL